MNSELNTFKKDTRKRVQENIIRLRDTRGNEYYARRIELPYEKVSILCEKVRDNDTKSITVECKNA